MNRKLMEGPQQQISIRIRAFSLQRHFADYALE
jgi:hypothetical protein